MPRAALFAAFLGLCAVSLGGCINEGGYPEETPDAAFDEIDCLAPGSNCGGGKLCCPGTICKGGKCSQDRTCVSAGGHCGSSAQCCGLATCRGGVCDMGQCSRIGSHCQGSADCCGAGVCRDGVCR